MRKDARKLTGTNGDAPVAVDMRVRVYPGIDAECGGVVVEDFGQPAGYPVDIGAEHIADSARRWAVVLDTGVLVFADSDQLLPE